MSTAEFRIIRHAKHSPDAGDVLVGEAGLTLQGIAEARTLGSRIGLEGAEHVKLESYDQRRALATLAIAANPSMDISDMEGFLRTDKIRINTDLDYIQPQEGRFADDLLQAYLKNDVFSFLAAASDEYYRPESPISSYSMLAATAARLIRRTADKTSETTLSLVCAREFVFPSFTAKSLGYIGGPNDEASYVAWYASAVEGGSDSTSHITEVTKRSQPDGSGVYELRDGHAVLELDDKIIEQIISDGETLSCK